MTPRKNFDHIPHGLARALSIMGEWWTPLIIHSLHEGNHRFEEIQASLGIARNILTDRLTTLVSNGVVRRDEYNSRPQRYEYRLTESGEELIPILDQLRNWGDKWFNGDDDDDGPAGAPARV